MKRILALVVALLVTACGSSINGTWIGTEVQGGYGSSGYGSSGYGSSAATQATATLTANGSTITGTFTSGILRATGQVTGAYNGNQITSLNITFQNGSCPSPVTGSGSVNGSTMTLTLTGCGMTETVQLQKQ